TKSTRMLGTASALNASRGANDEAPDFDGGVWGSARQNAASTSDAIPDTVNVLDKAASISGPVLSVPRAVPNQEMSPSVWANDGTLAQSIGMKMNGQLAAIQPIVPQTRMNPKSFLASLMLANAIAFVTDMVGT